MILLWTLALYAAGTMSAADTFEGYMDGWILLPCVYRAPVMYDSLNVFWRDKDDRVVLDVFNGKISKMDPMFDSRVVTFQDQYKQGNFSIVLTNLRLEDAGPYDCHVPRLSFHTKVLLRVTDRMLVAGGVDTGKSGCPTVRGCERRCVLHTAKRYDDCNLPRNISLLSYGVTYKEHVPAQFVFCVCADCHDPYLILVRAIKQIDN